jgi:AraC-like DNA-binding protein
MVQAQSIEPAILDHAGMHDIPQGSENMLPRGKMVEVETSNGGCVSLYDLHFDQQFSGTRTTEPMLQVCIMLEGNGVSSLSGCPNPILYHPGYCFLFYASKSMSAKHVIPADSQMTLVELRFEADYGNNFFPDTLSLLKKDVFLFSDDVGGDVWLARFPTPAAIRCLACDMLDKKTENASDKFWFEAKSLEVLSGITELLEAHADPYSGGRIELSRRDQKAIHDAYDMMLTEPEHDWTIQEIARTVGLNENKLKRGFGSIFGTSVYACLQQHRMTVAADRIRNDSDSITMIALSVGYSSPAHFAKVFRRYYGVSPRVYRRKS